ncbi:anhydro-N-acetylmuramic acid kinase [Vibrio tapetis]|uniref:Anhydro-N-acetylmuramic acid kinase n=1 Tax=Vibrio tapetis subsp. tapetis TaxID=1671868 RepID=A0A2N8ZF35_9VIBR|nr:anhydro-N-acetylmuramic acid kinase [Vibrio tapetis]SON50524.1 anhydro-N-acetylmuramic acid kinase [Vibrio tapetis subsp. tapetis]
MKDAELYIGVMSGTSMDGVDCALVSIKNDQVILLDHHFTPMPSKLKKQLLSVCLNQSTNIETVGRLDHQLGHLFADAVISLLQKSNTKPSDVVAIGNHGQTLFHQPTGSTPFTMQLGDANIIAAKTEITTIADFRRKDLALGGQGAPLVPAFHRALFEAKDASVVVLNIGGISNISVLHPNKPVIGYDTGPGNMLMDAWIYAQQGKKYDHNAEFALSGQVNNALINQLLEESYLSLSAPKSTGRELFNLEWLHAQLARFSTQQELASCDVQATLTEFTAVSITNEVRKYACGVQPQLLVCGGGACNPLLMQRLQQLLPEWLVDITSNKGVDSDYMEAMAFAWLAYRRQHNLPSNVPEVTGASRLASLGVIYPA